MGTIGVFTGPNTFVAGCSQAQIDSKVCVNAGGDYNLDGIRNDRPNASANHFTPSHDQWANGWGPGFQLDPNTDDASSLSSANGLFSVPCLGCNGNMARNSFVGPSFVSWETSLFKNIRITERVKMEFRAEAFNVLNHTNFQLPGAQWRNQYADQLRQLWPGGRHLQSRATCSLV